MHQHDFYSLVTIFENYLNEHPPKGEPDTLYQPIHYINSLGGKRIRPVLLLMAYNIWHDNVTPALPAALAIEYFHNFTLMHDDIMDEAPLRRGKESVHLHFSKNAAILSGDAMLIKSFDLLIDLENRNKLGNSIAMVLAKTAIEICEGQQMDIDFEKLTAPTEAEYLEMIRKKTACLIGCSLRIGALLAGASNEEANSLYSFGENIGLAFQIQDDMLDTFGETEVTGKQQGGDILRGKKNFPYVYAYNNMNESEKQEFMRMYDEVALTKDVRKVTDRYHNLEIQKYVDKVSREYFEKAIECLNVVAKNGSELRKFAEEIMGRRN